MNEARLETSYAPFPFTISPAATLNAMTEKDSSPLISKVFDDAQLSQLLGVLKPKQTASLEINAEKSEETKKPF